MTPCEFGGMSHAQLARSIRTLQKLADTSRDAGELLEIRECLQAAQAEHDRRHVPPPSDPLAVTIRAAILAHSSGITVEEG